MAGHWPGIKGVRYYYAGILSTEISATSVYFTDYFIKILYKVCLPVNISDSLHNIVISVSFTPLNWVFLALFHNRITFVDGQPLLQFLSNIVSLWTGSLRWIFHIYIWPLINKGLIYMIL